MDAKPTPTIEAIGIGRRNPKADGWLIRDVNLVLNAGERVGILGPSGAGKTVLLRALARLDPIEPGSIRWQGRAIEGESVPSYRSQVIYLHQKPALLDGSVEENLRLPYTLKTHQARRFDADRILGHLARVGRDHRFLEKASRDLSGGESQIVGLLRAIQLDPAVLLLDEPTAALDSATARAVEKLLEDWRAAGPYPRAWVWVSHDREQAIRMTDRRLLLRAGVLEDEERD